MNYYRYENNTSSLMHYGVPGMKWGVRHDKRIPLSTKRAAKRDAKEYARSRMFYGEGAGNRRKLINATVKQRSIDPAYKEAFDMYLANQNMATHAAKARGERRRKDVIKSTAKTARGLKNAYLGNAAYASTGALAIYAIAHYTGADKKIASYAKTAVNEAIRIAREKNFQRVVEQTMKRAVH